MSDLLDKLMEAEAEVSKLKREIASASCRETGHDWQFDGGRNAGCCDDCTCSVPVHTCAKCGDCDYGDNAEADEVRAECTVFTRGNEGCGTPGCSNPSVTNLDGENLCQQHADAWVKAEGQVYD